MQGHRDHTLKLRRAREHFKSLQALVGEWRDGQHHTVTVEDDSEAGYVACFVSGEQPAREVFGLLIGEFLHNLRSSLDLLVYELAETFTQPFPQEFAEDSEFPIFGDRSKKGQSGVGPRLWTSNAPRKLRGVDPRAVTEIERLQPYQSGANYVRDPLWQLHDLDRINKHRLVHVTVNIATGGIYDPVLIRGVMDEFQRRRRGQLDGGRSLLSQQKALFQRLPLPEGMDKDDVKMHLLPALRIVLECDSAEADPEPVLDRLASLYNHIVGSVLPRLEPFLP